MADSRAAHQLNIYSKELAAEVRDWAARESENTGHELPKNTLAREVFAWAWPIYKAAGSLSALKKIKSTDFEHRLTLRETAASSKNSGDAS